MTTPVPAPRGNPQRRLKRIRLTRDSILFGTGLLGIAYETLVANGDRPALLVIFGAMVGLPAFIHTDERKTPLPPEPPDDPPESAS